MNGADTLTKSDNDDDGHQLADRVISADLAAAGGRVAVRGYDSVAGVLGGICRAHDASSGRDCFAAIEIAWYFRNATGRKNDGTFLLPPYYR
jgi:hypothetical protein